MDWIDEFISLDVGKTVYGGRRFPRLMYIWGHSFEFDNNDNWDYMESLTDKLSGRDDIWYATNIEIYDYVNAYLSLGVSADRSKIYNPTLHTVWLDIGAKSYSIKPGELLRLR